MPAGARRMRTIYLRRLVNFRPAAAENIRLYIAHAKLRLLVVSFESTYHDGEPAAEVSQALEGFVEAARAAFGTNLVSVTLYGSGAEGRIRASSDVNLIVVLDAVVQDQM